MKKYKVTFLAITERDYEVEAKDFEEAKDLAITTLEIDDEVSNAWKSDARVVDIEEQNN
jgi:hypothetical protein